MSYADPEDPSSDDRNGLIVLVIMIAIVLLSGCQQVPRERMPSREASYQLPPCEVAPTPGTPCRKPVVRRSRSWESCNKRFPGMCQ